MRPEEAKEAIETLKEKGMSDEELLYSLYGMFKNDEIDVNELGDLVQLVGYELTDEFKNMSPEDQKTKGVEKEEETEPSVASDKKEEKEEKEEPTVSPDASKEKTEPSEFTPEEEEKARSLFGFK